MSDLVEINFDGIVGPSHNYAGLSPGNIASAGHAGDTAYPRAAALQGIAKMRHNLSLGLAQGFFVPLPRPNTSWLKRLNVDEHSKNTAHLQAMAWSASAMWTANAATVSPAPDTEDGRCHLTVANLSRLPHRSHEWPDTLAQLRVAFADREAFAVHAPVPAPFGDEGAANHMRLACTHDAPGVEIFVHGAASKGSGGAFPVRQNVEASRAVARLHGLSPDRAIFAEQAPEAIAAGAFHNDVVAVANETTLFAHERAFTDPDELHERLRGALPEARIVTVPAARVSLDDAIRSYLFNAQLVTEPDGAQSIIVPEEAREIASVWDYLSEQKGPNGAFDHMHVVNVRQSMANGGGPACLRLRVVADPARVDPRFLADADKLDRIAAVIEARWPERIAPGDLGAPHLCDHVEGARLALLDALDLNELASSIVSE